MSGVVGVIRRQSLRVRITLAFVATAALLASALAGATYVTVHRFLEDQRIRSATRQTVFGLLFARESLGARPDAQEELVTLLQTRGSFDALLVSPSDYFSTSLALTPQAIPADLRALVTDEELAYRFTRLGQSRVLAFGAPLPPPGTDLYLFYSLQDFDETMSLLARVLIVAGFAVVTLAVVFAQRVSARVIRPLGAVSGAAQRVAEGLLETRVQAATSDEVGVLAASFNQMAAALQDMIERERRFVASVSHELRTPLAALRTTSELLVQRRDAMAPGDRETIELIAEDVENLQHLVEELMEVSELEAGRAPVRWEELSLRSLVEAIASKRRASVTVEGDAPRTYADKARLERVIGNLIDNALAHGEGRDVRASITHEGDVVLVRISDRGPGIAQEDLPHLFDRFYKADRSRTREHGGIGLGLTIAAENAALLGGRIDVASRPNEGAAFTLRLPFRTSPPEDTR